MPRKKKKDHGPVPKVMGFRPREELDRALQRELPNHKNTTMMLQTLLETHPLLFPTQQTEILNRVKKEKK